MWVMTWRGPGVLAALLGIGLSLAGSASAKPGDIYTATTRYVIDGVSHSFDSAMACEYYHAETTDEHLHEVYIAAPFGAANPNKDSAVLRLNRPYNKEKRFAPTYLDVRSWAILRPGQPDIAGPLVGDDGKPAVADFNVNDSTFTYKGHTTLGAPHTVELQISCAGYRPDY
jgi:hypothetical protein